MSAADRMTVRTRDGKTLTVPRKVGLGMVARNQARVAKPVAPVEQPVKAVRAKGPVKAVKAAVVAPVKPERVVAPVVPAVKPARVKAAPVEPVPEPVVEPEPVVKPEPQAEVEPAVTDLPVEVETVPVPRGNASRAKWAAYATYRGVDGVDVMTRNQIRSAIDTLDNARMSQPAFGEYAVGGRLDTPEDEPVTEDTVTHGNPGQD